MAENGKNLRVPPNSYEAEQSILGSMLLDAKSVDEALVRLKPADFYQPHHRDIFAVAAFLVESGIPVDIVTVAERLEQEGKMHVGGLEYLSQLTNVVPSVANLSHYIKIVEEKASMRSLIEACIKISDDCFLGENEAEVLIGRAGDAIYQIAMKNTRGDVIHIKEALQESYQRIGEAMKSKEGMLGLSTGFPYMDEMLSGLQGTQLIVLAARPGMGKTSFALNIVEHIGHIKKIPCLIFSLEMGAEQLATRLLCSEAQVDSNLTRSGRMNAGQITKLADAMKVLSVAPIYIDDTASITVTEMLAKAHRMKRTSGLGLIVIDYLQLMQGSGRVENRQQEISAITRSLKIMAKELNIPILLLSQLSRANEKRDKNSRKPMLSDLRESGAIEQDADVVIFLHRDDYYRDEQEEMDEQEKMRATAIIAKQRSGQTGNINLVWHGEYTKYVEVDEKHQTEPEY